MPETITIPGTNKKIPRWVAIAGIGGFVVLIVILTRNKSTQVQAPEGEYYDDLSDISSKTAGSLSYSQTPAESEIFGPIASIPELPEFPFENVSYPVETELSGGYYPPANFYTPPMAESQFASSESLTPRPAKMSSIALNPEKEIVSIGDTTDAINAIREKLGGSSSVAQRAAQYTQAAANIKAQAPTSNKPAKAPATVQTNTAKPSTSLQKAPQPTTPARGRPSTQQKSGSTSKALSTNKLT